MTSLSLASKDTQQMISSLNKFNKNNCSICLENLYLSDCLFTPCCHCFHYNCLSIWINVYNKNICPNCNSTLPPFSKTIITNRCGNGF